MGVGGSVCSRVAHSAPQLAGKATRTCGCADARNLEPTRGREDEGAAIKGVRALAGAHNRTLYLCCTTGRYLFSFLLPGWLANAHS